MTPSAWTKLWKSYMRELNRKYGTRSLADQAEKAGSIQVAVIQLANTCGAAIGGYALDNIGLTSPLMLSGTLMLLTALLVTAKVKMKKS